MHKIIENGQFMKKKYKQPIDTRKNTQLCQKIQNWNDEITFFNCLISKNV